MNIRVTAKVARTIAVRGQFILTATIIAPSPVNGISIAERRLFIISICITVTSAVDLVRSVAAQNLPYSSVVKVLTLSKRSFLIS